jgi:RNA polymerase sigma-B factor
VFTFLREVMTVAEPRNILDETLDETDAPPRSQRIAETERLLKELPHSPDPIAVQHRVVRLNMVVAREVARRYEGRGLSADDLEQVAYLGLVKAVQHFDAAKGRDFLSYAVPTIRGEVRRWFRDGGWMVRPPRSVQELQARITRARSELTHDLGRPPTPGEVAEELGEELGAVERAMAANGCFAPSSLDTTPSSDEDEGRPSLAQRLGAPDPGYAEVEARVVLRPLFRELDERERLMLRMRFEQGATQAEIGRELGVTQTQVSRLMTGLLSRMRERLDGTVTAA